MTDTLNEHADPTLHKGEPLIEMTNVGKSYGAIRALSGINLSVGAGEVIGNEFLYIIAAVVGGTLLTGGFGSAIGTAIGAFIFGMTVQGIVYAGWDPNWSKAFLGVMLLLAVAVNLYVKKLATTRKA